jgi:uncharacterized membrane protein (DUF485 family)
MADSTTTVAGYDAPTSAADRVAEPVDWETIARSPEFRELLARRRRFVVPATIFFLAWYFGFIVLAGYAEGFMGHSLYEGFTVGYALALSQFVMTWGLCWLYLRKSDREFDPLAERVVDRFAPDSAADEPLTRQPYEQEVGVR